MKNDKQQHTVHQCKGRERRRESERERERKREKD
jgi:hypothetical protein